MSDPAQPQVLSTTAGDIALRECRLSVGGQQWSVLYTGAILSYEDEAKYLTELASKLPYGVVLWPAAIALAHEIATRADEFRGRTVLELGAGTGLPGIVAASVGAKVVQTDRNELALAAGRLNGERNGVTGVEYRLADWNSWDDPTRFDWVIGSDITYADSLHPLLRPIFERNLASGGRLLLADPFRATSLQLFEAMQADGWRVTHSKWTVGEQPAPRPVGVFELSPPSQA